MTSYSLTILEQDFERLREVLRTQPDVENAAYLLCRISRSETEVRLLVREVIPIAPEHLLETSASHMKIASSSFLRAMKRADHDKSAFVFVHTHPAGHPQHSEQDDLEEAHLFRTAYNRVHADVVHASLVVSGDRISAARVWLDNGTHKGIERVRIIGTRFEFWFAESSGDPVSDFYDRQVRAFGPDIQPLLGRLRIGVVGVGGTGSAVVEQLTRLGIGELVLVDGQAFDASNVNRLYGSRVIDQDIAKVKIAERSIADVGLGTKVTLLDKPISYRSVFSQLRNCDIVFGCTDDQWGRSLLSRLAIYYGIPVFDVGVGIDSNDGVIRSVQGRVTTLQPGAACLFCRGRITTERVALESMRETNPAAAAERVRLGYAPELEAPAPAVITFTTAVAASAISELLHKLTGFMGVERAGTELLHLFDVPSIRRNTKVPKDDCFCAPRSSWMKGDTRPLLDTTWRAE